MSVKGKIQTAWEDEIGGNFPGWGIEAIQETYFYTTAHFAHRSASLGLEQTDTVVITISGAGVSADLDVTAASKEYLQEILRLVSAIEEIVK